MKTYIVRSNYTMPKISRDEIKQFHQINFFEPLAILVNQSDNQIIITDSLLRIGIAIVEATDLGKTILEKANYKVSENTENRLFIL